MPGVLEGELQMDFVERSGQFIRRDARCSQFADDDARGGVGEQSRIRQRRARGNRQ